MNEARMAMALGAGSAVCPKCFRVHVYAGREHLRSPWTITPRCTDCGTVLRMPQTRQAVVPERPTFRRHDRDRRIRELWGTGLTLTQVGMEIGASQFTVSRAARRMGLPSRIGRCGQRPDRRVA